MAGTTIVVSIFGQIPGSPINAAKKLTVSVKSISMKVGDKKLVKQTRMQHLPSQVKRLFH